MLGFDHRDGLIVSIHGREPGVFHAMLRHDSLMFIPVNSLGEVLPTASLHETCRAALMSCKAITLKIDPENIHGESIRTKVRIASIYKLTDVAGKSLISKRCCACL